MAPWPCCLTGCAIRIGGRLFLYDVADPFDGFANLAFPATHGRLGLSGELVDDAFVVQIRIALKRTGRLFDLAFECFGLPFEFIAIHGMLFSL